MTVVAMGMPDSTEFHKHLSVPFLSRDENWEKKFFEIFPSSVVTLESEEVLQAPDGWPVLSLCSALGPGEPVKKILDWIKLKGVGLVLNAHKDVPDYVMSYGMIWSYCHFDSFYGPDSLQPPQESELVVHEGLSYGAPDEVYLPKFAREPLKGFFKDQGIDEFKVAMIGSEENGWDLGVDMRSLGNPPKNEYKGIAEAISWFLPLNYSLVLVDNPQNIDFKVLA